MLRLLWQSKRGLSITVTKRTSRCQTRNAEIVMFFSLSSPSRPSLHNYYLRKRRKWPLSPYKTKWHVTFAHQQAMEQLKQSADASNAPLLSALIDSFASYECDPSPSAYHFIIKTLTQNPSKWDQIPQVLDHIQKVATFETPEYIFIDLIKFYSDSNMIRQAIELFYRIPNFRCSPSVHSLNALLSVLCEKRWGLEMVPRLLIQSRSMNIRIEGSSFGILIRALCRIGKFNHAVELVNYMGIDGFDMDGRICSLILRAMCHEKEYNGLGIMCFLEEMRKFGFTPNRGDWHNVIRLLVKRGNVKDAVEALTQMKVDGIEPDLVCYNLVLNRLLLEEDHMKADELFDQMLVLGLVPDIFTYNAYISGLCKQNKVEEGIKMLGCMYELDCRPDLITYCTILRALLGSGELNLAREVMRKMELKGVQPNSETYGLMIDGLLTNGEIAEACELLREMTVKCFISEHVGFDKVICGLCQRGMFHKAFGLLNEMVDKNVAPGAIAWEALLQGSALTHSFAQIALVFESIASELADRLPQP